jgi:hypothetical protein
MAGQKILNGFRLTGAKGRKAKIGLERSIDVSHGFTVVEEAGPIFNLQSISLGLLYRPLRRTRPKAPYIFHKKE